MSLVYVFTAGDSSCFKMSPVHVFTAGDSSHFKMSPVDVFTAVIAAALKCLLFMFLQR